ncbi:uncharacterized protein SPPG_03806 [Spizellomyces punctatus DAOM BR117]|uniref:Pyridoxal-dependent decarboxylase n=1 Tax=Spizellomyces punctatus (strain DAOM BR117) TaxID=645134 RepID=A0A0L0HIP1_SPIPD|nr:uncharacterized protein SPPG_03806 [Spizellomyces punctatus DAOM BR117]KND00684.1 hypothetical protein SPPG_03806 [Spizellomyces punctatus DAOM BR117]|eukprot:XP_016608723.1 hypothetical protein SPPG_03806 [Spizellomyces punctatus DAOM BR117]
MPAAKLPDPCNSLGGLTPKSVLPAGAAADPRPLTPESEDIDEGYDEDFPDDFPFWYGGASGVQRIGATRKASVDAAPCPENEHEGREEEHDGGEYEHGEPRERRSSYHDHDSVLHYFVATSQSENKLDRYLSNIIEAFLNEPAPIYATQPDTPESMRARFVQSEVPLRSKAAGQIGVASAEEYLRTVKSNVIDRATRVSSPKMIGHMTTALPYFHRPLARLLAAMNQNVVKLETASTMTYLERQTVAMLHREFYNNPSSFYEAYMHSPEHSLGVFCSGGTIANITAMWAARNRALPSDPQNGFKGVEKEGLFKALKHYGYEGAVIVGSRLMHYSFKKAADLLGLGDEGLVTIDSDDAFRMRMDELEAKLSELQAKKYLIIAVVGIAGTTETGSIDPLDRIALQCQRQGIHFHVDAAWGGPLIFSAEHRPKLHGIHHADTITVDGHKQLYTPMGLGLLLFQHPTTAHAIRKTANYVIRHDSPDLGKFTLEGSRPAISLHLHASLHLLGRDGLECLVTRSATLARQMSVRIDTHPSYAFQGLHLPETNIFLFRYLPKELRVKVHTGEPLTEEEDASVSDCTRRVQVALASAGTEPSEATQEPSPPTGFVSRTRVRFHGRDVDAFRVVIANPLTSWDDVEDVLRNMLIIGAKVEAEIANERRPLVAQHVPTVQKVDGNVKEDISRWSELRVPQKGEKMWVGWPFDM